MSDRRGIALQALRAAGHEQAADLVEAIIPAEAAETVAPAPVAPAVPAAVSQDVSVPVAALAVTLPTPPVGKAPLRNIDEFEALPQAERLARMDECDELIRKGER